MEKLVQTLKVRKTDLHWENPITGNPVCYERARQKKFLNQRSVKVGLLNPNTGRIVSNITRILQLGLAERRLAA